VTPRNTALARALVARQLTGRCQIIARASTERDPYGGTRPVTTTVPVACAVQPARVTGARELVEAGVAGATSNWRIYLPAQTTIDADAEIEWLDPTPTRRFRVIEVDGGQTAEVTRRAYCVERD